MRTTDLWRQRLSPPAHSRERGNPGAKTSALSIVALDPRLRGGERRMGWRRAMRITDFLLGSAPCTAHSRASGNPGAKKSALSIVALDPRLRGGERRMGQQ